MKYIRKKRNVNSPSVKLNPGNCISNYLKLNHWIMQFKRFELTGLAIMVYEPLYHALHYGQCMRQFKIGS